MTDVGASAPVAFAPQNEAPGAGAPSTLTPDGGVQDPAPAETKVAVKQKPAKAAPKQKPVKGAVVGLSVQFCQNRDAANPASPLEILPAILMRPAITEPHLWDLIVFVTGGVSIRHRHAIRHSAKEQKAGHWNFVSADPNFSE